MRKIISNAWLTKKVVSFATTKIILVMMITIGLTFNGWGQTPCPTAPSARVHCDLVGNGDFENYAGISTSTTFSGGQVNLACPWYTPFNPTLHGAGYFHSVNQVNNLTPPGGTVWSDYTGVNSAVNTLPQTEYNLNYEGWQSSCSLNGVSQVGEGYSGFYAYKECDKVLNLDGTINYLSYHTNGHIYLTQQLPCKLLAGVPYDISFWVSLADFSTHSTNHLGMFLSPDNPSSANYETVDGLLQNTFATWGDYEGQMAHTTAGSLTTTSYHWIAHEPVIPQVKQVGYGNGTTGFIVDGNTNSTGWFHITTGGTPFIPLVDMEYITIGDFGTINEWVIQPGPVTHSDNSASTTNPSLLYNGFVPYIPLHLRNPVTYNTVNDRAYYYLDGVTIRPHGGVYPAPVVSTTSNSCEIVVGGSTAYTITPHDDNITYTIVVDDPNGYTDGATPTAGSDGIFQINWLTGHNCGEVTVNVTMHVCDGDCDSQTGTYEITGCCDAGDGTVNLGNGGNNVYSTGGNYRMINVGDVGSNIGINLDSHWSTPGLPSVIVTGAKFAINGLFTVNHNLTLDDCEVLMGPEAKIIVNPGISFEIENSYIHSCCENEMWNTIELGGRTSGTTKELLIYKSLIEDADSAVTCLMGGRYDLDESIFNKNYKGLVVRSKGYLAAMPVGDYSVGGCIFTCRDLSLLNLIPDLGTIGSKIHNLEIGDYSTSNFPDYSNIFSENHFGALYPFATLNEPVPDNANRSFTGIEVWNYTNTSPIEFGIQAGLLGNGERNTFDYLDFGIRSIYSNTDVYNNLFVNIYDVIGYGGNDHCDLNSIHTAGVWATVKRGDTSPYHLTVGGYTSSPLNANKPNQFYFSSNGVYSYNYNNDITNNHFEWIFTNGVFLDDGIKRTNHVWSNRMLRMKYGINCLNLLTDVFTDIKANIIDVAPHPEIVPCYKIKHSFGIGVFNQGQTKTPLAIIDNTINLFSPANLPLYTTDINIGGNSADGIRVEQVDGDLPVSNVYTWNVTQNMVHFKTPLCTVADEAKGIWLVGDNLGDVRYNLIDDLVPMGTGPQQQPNVNDAYYGIYTENTTNTKVFYNTMNYMCSGISAIGGCLNTDFGCNALNYGFDGFNFFSPTLAVSELSTGQATGNIWTGTRLTGFDIDGIVPSGLIWYDYSTPSILLSSLVSLNPLPTNLTGACGSFGGEPMQAGEQREKMFGRIVRGENTYDTLSAEFLLRDSIYAYKNLAKYDSLRTLGEPEDSTYENFYSYCYNENIGSFERVDMFLIDSLYANIAAAQAINDNIPTQGSMEENQKIVNTVLLNQAAYEMDSTRSVNDRYVFSESEVTQLEGVAYQNPELGGNSVYQARTMLWIDVSDDKSVHVKSMIQQGVHTEKSYSFNLFPNPTSGNITLEYKLEPSENGVFGIYNLAGKAIKKYPLNNANTTTIIDENQLSAGTYIWAVKVDDKLVKMKKLIIIK